MRTWLRTRWEDIRSSFWFVPTLMVTGSVLLAFATLGLDHALGASNWVAKLQWTVNRGPEGSRQLLASVAGSMITIASLTFSITIVALQLASSQFGPRLLRNFMRDLGNQLTLGTFIATFTYCLLILRSVNGTEENTFVPHLSVTVGMLLTLASLGVLIYFIHHAAESIQADRVIDSVGNELVDSVDWLFPGHMGHGPRVEGYIAGGLPDDFARLSRPVPAASSGYVQGIDHEGLMGLARERDLVLQIVARPGKFVIEGSPLVLAWPPERAGEAESDAIAHSIYLGSRRTITQDVEFAIDQLVEVALRALSPGINDPFTAIACIDRLGVGLAELGSREFPSPYRHDEEDRLRIVADTSTPAGVVDAAFHQIRQAARGNAAVSLRLLEVIAAVAERTTNDEFREAFRRHADLILHGTQDAFVEEADRREARDRHDRAMRALGPAPAGENGRVPDGVPVPPVNTSAE